MPPHLRSRLAAAVVAGALFTASPASAQIGAPATYVCEPVKGTQPTVQYEVDYSGFHGGAAVYVRIGAAERSFVGTMSFIDGHEEMGDVFLLGDDFMLYVDMEKALLSVSKYGSLFCTVKGD